MIEPWHLYLASLHDLELGKPLTKRLESANIKAIEDLTESYCLESERVKIDPWRWDYKYQQDRRSPRKVWTDSN